MKSAPFVTLGILAALASPLRATVESAKPADSFVDSQGVNTHYINSAFAGNAYSFTALDQKIADLGIRHLRDNTAEDPTNPAGYSRIDSLFTSYGIRSTLVLGSTINSPATLANILKSHPGYEAIEGLNEPDANVRSYNGFTDAPASNSYPATKAYQNDIYNAVKADGLTAGRSVLSPAMGNSSKSQYLLGALFDDESMHSYPNGRNPTSNLDTKISQVNQMASPSKPIMATETGYYTKPNDGGEVSELAMGKYVPRLYAEYFSRGIVRTFDYEMVDENPTTDKESNFGLLHWDLTPKPAYTALKNLNDLIKEPGASSTPGTLNYTLTAPSTVHHTLVEKSDGTMYLMLWNDVLSWNVTTQQDIVNADVAATLTINDSYFMAELYEPNVSASAFSVTYNPSTLNLNIPDQVLVVELSHVPEPTSAAALFVLVLATRPRRRLTRSCFH